MALTDKQAAETGLHFEVNWDKIDKRIGTGTGEELDLYAVTGDESLKGYTIIDSERIPDCEGTDKLKCIAVQGPDGNVYIHFNGTGDGNWGYNESVYTGVDSVIQERSTEFLNDVIRNRVSDGQNVYVSGHSQGGCTAQYATMFADPECGERITHTTSLDGPGLSDEDLERLMLDSDYYEQQRRKLYAFNGNSDYVSPLGERQIIPEDHVFMVWTSDRGYKDNPDENAFVKYHASQYMLNHNGTICHWVPYGDPNNGETPFRKFVIRMNNRILQEQPEDRAAVAHVAMNLAEHFLGGGKDINVQGDPLTQAEFDKFKKIMVPVLADVMQEDPEQLYALLRDMGLDPTLTEAVIAYLQHFEGMSPEHQRQALETLFNGVKIGEDGKPALDLAGLLTNPSPGATLAIVELVITLVGTEEGRALIGKLTSDIHLMTMLDGFLRKNLPGYDAVMNRIQAFSQEKGLDSPWKLIKYMTLFPREHAEEFLIFLLSDWETVKGLVQLAGVLTLIANLMPIVIAILGIAGKLLETLVKLYVAFLVLQLVVEFLVKVWNEIVAKVEAAIEWVEEMAKRIYDYVTEKIEAAVNAAIHLAKVCYDNVKRFAKETYEKAVAFGNYVKQQIRAGINYLNDIAHAVGRTISGTVQQAVTLHMQLLQEAVDKMDRLAARVQAMDCRLDSLYGWLCRSMVEQSEGVFVTLANLYQLTWADLNVDEGNRIRRMAKNLSCLNDGYKTVEQWVFGQL